jgi:hypothetical protein
LHMDSQSTLEGDIREGTNVVAQLGDAGYAIRVQEYHYDDERTPTDSGR